jgi:RES domain-containing protein
VPRVYRCIGARRWDSGDPMAHVPPLDLPVVPGRWNDSGQYTLYTSHRAAVAIEEKRRHLARSARSVVGSILAAVGDPPASEVVVLSFEGPAEGPADSSAETARLVPDSEGAPGKAQDPRRARHDLPSIRMGVGAAWPVRTFDGTAEPRESFDRWLEPCGNARAYAARLIRRGFAHLVVPSSPCPADWNSVFYLLGPGQPGAEALPRRSVCRVTRRVRVTSTEPDCPPLLDRRRRVTVN